MAKERTQKLPLTELQLRDASAVLEQLPELFSDNKVQRALAFVIGQYEKRGIFLKATADGKLYVDTGLTLSTSGIVSGIVGTGPKTLTDLATALAALRGSGVDDFTSLITAVAALKGAGPKTFTEVVQSLVNLQGGSGMTMTDLYDKMVALQTNITDLGALITSVRDVLQDVHDSSAHALHVQSVT
jgi:hypothetical protein